MIIENPNLGKVEKKKSGVYENPRKFLMQDWGNINAFIDSNLTPEHLVELTTNS